MKNYKNKTSFIQKAKNYFNPKLIQVEFNYRKRAFIMSAIFFAALFLILMRYAYLTVLPTDLRTKLLATGSRQFETSVTLSKPRATITDRNGKVLAVSVSSTSLFILTRKMPKDEETLRKLAKQIKVPYQDLEALKKEKKNFVWLKRQMTQTELNEIGSIKKWKNF